MKLDRLPFSSLFPLVELVIWVILVPVPTTLIYMGLHRSTQPEVIHTEIGTFTVPPQEVRRFAIQAAAWRNSHAITALNTPGMIVEALISWHPAELPMDVWRSITLPFFCLPAWWFIGYGFDSFRNRQIRWQQALIGSLLFITFIVLFCGLRFEVPPDERAGGSWILWGIALWALLFGIFPLAWLSRQPIQPDEVLPAQMQPPAC